MPSNPAASYDLDANQAVDDRLLGSYCELAINPDIAKKPRVAANNWRKLTESPDCINYSAESLKRLLRTV